MKQPTPSATEASSLGAQLVGGIARKDAAWLRSLFATPVTFRAITPKRFWDAETPVEVVDEIMLGRWFDTGTSVTDVTFLDTGTVGDVEKVSFRMLLELPSGRPAVVEQSAYYSVTDGRITDMRLVCSGFRPL